MSKVADIKAMFNQGELPLTKPPPAIRNKPAVSTSKPKTTNRSPGQTNGSTKGHVPVIPNGLNLSDIGRVQLRKTRESRPSSSTSFGSEEQNDNTPNLLDYRNKLKKVPDSPIKIGPKPVGSKPTHLAPKPAPVAPKPAPVALKPGVKPKPSVSPRPRVGSQSTHDKGDSEGTHHSATGSIGSVRSDGSLDGPFILAPLPPLETIGSAPRKPPKPKNVRLPQPTGVSASRSRNKIASPHIPKAQEVHIPPPPANPVDDDFGETYDDVADVPPPLPSSSRPSFNKRISLIKPMESDDEDGEDEDFYDEGSSAPINDEAPPPAVPSIDSLPLHNQSSAGSSSSHIQTSSASENTGSGTGEVYDPVDEEHDFDELYEPLDIDQPEQSGGSGGDVEKEREAERKKQEQQKKEQERQQKKEEERRKKEERETKKRKEKADKELKKKYKVKGDWTILEMGTAQEDVADESDKFQIICTKGEMLEIIRKEKPNPSGKWLVRNALGDPGYIDAHLVQLAGDFGDEYDAVGLTDEADFQDVYDVAS